MIARRTAAAALLLAACCASVGSAEPAIDGLSRAVWARRLPEGPVKVVFLAPYGAQHDSFELMQRFDVDGTVLTMSARDTRGFIDSGFRVVGHYWPDLLPTEQEVRANMRVALSAEWEVVVMSGTPPWHRYPQDIRRSILEKVSAGRGLMIGGLDDGLRKDVEAMGLKLEETPIGAGRFVFRAGENGACQGHAGAYRCGKGRVVRFDATNHPAHGYILSASARQSDFEFSAGRAGWFLLRAARPGARSHVTGTRFADGDIVVEMDVGAGVPGGAVHVAVHRRDTYEKVLDTSEEATRGKAVTISLPQLPAGAYQAEVRAMDGEGTTLDWDAIRFTVSGRLKLKELAVDRREQIRPGETVNCRLDVEGQTTGLETVIRWYDNWNRLLLETAPRPFAQEMAITVPAGSLAVLNRLQVTIRSDRGPEAVGSVELLMPENVRPTDFHMLYWKNDVLQRRSPDSWRRRVQWDVLRRDGAADAWANCQPYVDEARDAALCHLRTAPYTTAFSSVVMKELLNEEWLAGTERRARETARSFRPYGALAYTLGDENHVSIKPEGRFADTPRAWAAFREYLRGVYPDLEALNAQWGTDFAAWDDIRFDSERQMLPSMDNPSAWVDYRMFVTRRFSDALQRMRRAICEEHPGAWVGWEGTTQFSSYDGIDWWQLCSDMEMVNVYHSKYVPDADQTWQIFNGEAVSSFGRDASLGGCWMNRADREFGGQYVPWYVLLNGWNSTWWWQATFLHPANGPLRWDLGLTPVAGAMAAAVKEIKRGPGTLLARARKDVSPIAVHYSATNWHASTIESGVANHVATLGMRVAFWMAPQLVDRLYYKDEEMDRIWGGITPKGHYAVASANFYTLLHDIGFEPRTMARQEIEAGALTDAGTRVLILPFVVSLSDLEVETIRQFVAGGGVLIADYRCGLRDGHGRLRERPALVDVFGIKRKGPEVRRERGTLVADIGGGVRFESIFHDAVAADGAEALACHDDGTAAFFVHPHGAGQAVYLNTDLYGYVDLRRCGQERRLREVFAALLVRTNHLFPPFQVKQRYGSAAGRMAVTRLVDGDTRYYGVLPAFDVEDKAPRPVILPFARGMHVYDVREQEYLGPGGPIEDTLHVGRPEMYAALPYPVEGLSVRAPQEASRGEPVEISIAVAAGIEEMGPHAVRVAVSLPDGRQPEYLGRTLYLPKGEGRYAFVPALNSPVGRWSVSAVEVVSGKRASARFHVR